MSRSYKVNKEEVEEHCWQMEQHMSKHRSVKQPIVLEAQRVPMFLEKRRRKIHF